MERSSARIGQHQGVYLSTMSAQSLQPFSCQRQQSIPRSRREMLRRCGGGLGALALAALGHDRGFSGDVDRKSNADRAGDMRHTSGLHHPARATRVIFLYMDGGPSQVDTFDPKPLLDRFHGQDPSKLFSIEPTQFNNNGLVLASPWKFHQYGQSGLPISDLFPHIATCAAGLWPWSWCMTMGRCG